MRPWWKKVKDELAATDLPLTLFVAVARMEASFSVMMIPVSRQLDLNSLTNNLLARVVRGKPHAARKHTTTLAKVGR
jgi:hypothetical protein